MKFEKSKELRAGKGVALVIPVLRDPEKTLPVMDVISDIYSKRERKMEIESPPESAIIHTEFDSASFNEAIFRSGITRGETGYVYIPKHMPEHVPPAFVEWKDKLQQGEKLPQGKYFRRQEIVRFWLNSMVSKNLKFSTVHVY